MHAWFALAVGVVGAFFGATVAPSPAEVAFAITAGDGIATRLLETERGIRSRRVLPWVLPPPANEHPE